MTPTPSKSSYFFKFAPKRISNIIIVKYRRYDLDWLPVIVILYEHFRHIEMPFNGQEFHIIIIKHEIINL